MGGPFGLDFGAIMAVAAARDVDADLLSEVLPAAEAAILASLDDGGEGVKGGE